MKKNILIPEIPSYDTIQIKKKEAVKIKEKCTMRSDLSNITLTTTSLKISDEGFGGIGYLCFLQDLERVLKHSNITSITFFDPGYNNSGSPCYDTERLVAVIKDTKVILLSLTDIPTEQAQKSIDKQIAENKSQVIDYICEFFGKVLLSSLDYHVLHSIFSYLQCHELVTLHEYAVINTNLLGYSGHGNEEV